jgi:hypothetical protein
MPNYKLLKKDRFLMIKHHEFKIFLAVSFSLMNLPKSYIYFDPNYNYQILIIGHSLN